MDREDKWDTFKLELDSFFEMDSNGLNERVKYFQLAKGSEAVLSGD